MRPQRHPPETLGILSSNPALRRQSVVAIDIGSSAEIVPFPLVLSHCCALEVGIRRAACPAIGALNRECAVADDLGSVPAEWTWLQYRDKLILFHLALAALS
jgi:hypothetical protein